MEHRDANLAALAALGPRKRKLLETSGSGTNQVLTFVSVGECDCVNDNQVWYVLYSSVFLHCR